MLRRPNTSVIALGVLLTLAACSGTSATTTVAESTTTGEVVATTAEPTTTSTEAPTTTVDESGGAGGVLVVPPVGPATVDGTMEPGEWNDAATVTMTDGSDLFWMSDGDTLYVALDGDALGGVNLAVATTDETWVLHSSAALGSALYRASESTWEIVHGFRWCCRSPNDDTERQELLDAEGWQANIGFSGDAGVVEYEVTIPWANAQAAVSYVLGTDEVAFWPTDLSATAQGQLVGSRSTDLDFRLDEWWTIVPGE